MDWQATRPGETSANLPDRQDAHLVFIGRLRTPFATRDQCPRQGDAEAGPVCRAEIDEPWQAALAGIEDFAWLDLLYWMHQARRDLVTQTPRGGQPLLVATTIAFFPMTRSSVEPACAADVIARTAAPRAKPVMNFFMAFLL